MPSPEASRRNLAIANAHGRPPLPWRSPAEGRMIRLITWQWLLGYGPYCSGRALARWLVVSHTYIQKLTRTLSKDPNDLVRELRCVDLPTLENLRLAREESRQLRERGGLRRPRFRKWTEFKIGDNVVRGLVPTQPKVVGLGTEVPVSSPPHDPKKCPRDFMAVQMLHLRVQAERGAAMRPWNPPRRRRWW
jgi:hypothetical protein